jgi:superfamily I DNA and/or RNA helicase
VGHKEEELYEANGFGVNENLQKLEDETNQILEGSTSNLLKFLSANLKQVIWKILKVEVSRAKLVFTTLNSSGSNRIKDLIGAPEVLIVDEACQSTEVQTLVPLRLLPNKMILVGDHRQLPATTFLYNSHLLNFECSLFERLSQMGHYVHLLRTQYRMVPDISTFISDQFYLGQLDDGSNVQVLNLYLSRAYCLSTKGFFFQGVKRLQRGDQKTLDYLFELFQNSPRVIANKPNLSKPQFLWNFEKFLGYLEAASLKSKDSQLIKTIGVQLLKRCSGFFFFDVKGVTSRERKSFKNEEEIRRVEEVVRFFSNGGVRNIGVISPYKAQTKGLRRALGSYEGERGEQGLEINTIDGFQGKQKDLIIISCVKSVYSKHVQGNLCSVGFLDDPRRGNVALSRAKYGVFIIGNRDVLESSAGFWKELLGMLESEGRCFEKEVWERGASRDRLTQKALIELFLDVSGDLFEKYLQGTPEQVPEDHRRDPDDDEMSRKKGHRFYYQQRDLKSSQEGRVETQSRNTYLKKRNNSEYATKHEVPRFKKRSRNDASIENQTMILKLYNKEIKKAIENTRKWNLMKQKDAFCSESGESMGEEQWFEFDN